MRSCSACSRPSPILACGSGLSDSSITWRSTSASTHLEAAGLVHPDAGRRSAPMPITCGWFERCSFASDGREGAVSSTGWRPASAAYPPSRRPAARTRQRALPGVPGPGGGGARRHQLAGVPEPDFLLYTYCQYELARQHPGEGHLSLYRGINRIDEHETLGREQDGSHLVLSNNLWSFTSERERADEFGDHLLSARVPIPRFLLEPVRCPGRRSEGRVRGDRRGVRRRYPGWTRTSCDRQPVTCPTPTAVPWSLLQCPREGHRRC